MPSSEKVSVLDHGYVQLIEAWGSDERIIESARMSTDGAFKGWGPFTCPECGGEGRVHSHNDFCHTCKGKKEIVGDEKLLKFLYDHKHATPFEFAGMTIEIQAPIVVFREWHRHRTQSYSELSARYTPLPDDNYMPSTERCMIVNGTNKQANAIAGAEVLTHKSVLEWLEELSAVYEHAEAVYQSGLRRGIPKEVARLPVPVGRYTRMRATANLRNWLAFMTLRCDEAAQWEIRQFANEVKRLIQQQFARTFTLWAGPNKFGVEGK